MTIEERNIIEPKKDGLSIAKENQISENSKETNLQLDAEFENLRRATELKDKIILKLNSILADHIKGDSFLQTYVNTETVSGPIENIFYMLSDDENKVVLMEGILTMIESTDKISVKETYDDIIKKLKIELNNRVFENNPDHLKQMLLNLLMLIGALIGLAAGSETFGTGLGLVAGFLVLTSLATSSLALLKKASKLIDKKVDKHEFFDMINEYVPNITKQDFEQLFDNIYKLDLKEKEEWQIQNFILSLLKDYKESGGIVSQEEISNLISTTSTLDLNYL